MIIQHKLNKGGGNAPQVTLDYTPVEGRYLVAFVAWNEDTGNTDFNSATLDPSWTLQEDINNSTNVRAKAFWKLAGPSEPTTVALGTLNTGKAWVMIVVELSDYIFNEDSSNNLNTGLTGFTDYLHLDQVPGIYLGFLVSKKRTSQVNADSAWTQLEFDMRDGGTDPESVGAGLYVREIYAIEPARRASATATTSTSWVGINFGWAGPNVYSKFGTLTSALSAGLADEVTNIKKSLVKSNMVLSGTKVKGLANIVFVRDPSTSVDGSYSAAVTTLALQTNEGIYTTFSPHKSGKHTLSAYLKGSGTVRFRITNNAGTSNIYTSGDFLLTSDWQRFSATTDVNLLLGTTYRIYIETSFRQGTVFWVDAVQVEMRKAASPFYPGNKPAGLGPVGAALKAAKPAGLIMNYDVIDGQTFQQLRDGHSGRTFAVVKSDYGTFEEARDDLPL